MVSYKLLLARDKVVEAERVLQAFLADEERQKGPGHPQVVFQQETLLSECYAHQER
jgi:hypothetical protein